MDSCVKLFLYRAAEVARASAFVRQAGERGGPKCVNAVRCNRKYGGSAPAALHHLTDGLKQDRRVQH